MAQITSYRHSKQRCKGPRRYVHQDAQTEPPEFPVVVDALQEGRHGGFGKGVGKEEEDVSDVYVLWYCLISLYFI